MLILSYFFIQHKIQLKRLLKCSFFHPRSNHLSNNCISWGGGGRNHAQVSLTTGCIPENYRFPAPHHTNDWYYVVTGNKQGCWFTSGWMEKEDGRLDLLSCLLSGAFIEKKFTRKLFIQVLYAPILSFSHCIQFGRRWREWAKQIFHSGVMRPQIWAFWHGERFAVPIQACMSTDALHCVLHLCIHLLILLSP